MGGTMSLLCTICARGGSVGVKNKNIRLLNNKPLIAHSILQAKATHLFDAVAISSDSDAIIATAKEHGADLLIQRPKELATNEAAKLPAIKHAVLEAEKHFNKTFSIIVDLDATSPLRSIDDIKAAVELLQTKNANNIITGTTARKSPYFNLVELDQDSIPRLCKPPISKVSRRQDSPPCFDMNASIYVWKRDFLMNNDHLFTDKTYLYVMPEERSIDIDNELDFEMVEFLAAKKKVLIS